MSIAKTRGVLWQAMVERAEALHDATVLGQHRADARAARRIQGLAEGLAVLARAIDLLNEGHAKP
ncbi:MAG: hypothetical protein BroJett013_36910 [Alphaproteobacteria bacterium]|nr:MAG: hypothetical protein BroJett013_36910 [Alphaproteobacteria bacterium]